MEPGFSTTVSPGLMTRPGSSRRIFMRPLSIFISCNSNAPAMGTEPPIRVSASLPVLVMVMKPAATLAPPGISRVHTRLTLRPPAVYSWATAAAVVSKAASSGRIVLKPRIGRILCIWQVLGGAGQGCPSVLMVLAGLFHNYVDHHPSRLLEHQRHLEVVVGMKGLLHAGQDQVQSPGVENERLAGLHAKARRRLATRGRVSGGKLDLLRPRRRCRQEPIGTAAAVLDGHEDLSRGRPLLCCLRRPRVHNLQILLLVAVRCRRRRDCSGEQQPKQASEHIAVLVRGGARTLCNGTRPRARSFASQKFIAMPVSRRQSGSACSPLRLLTIGTPTDTKPDHRS